MAGLVLLAALASPCAAQYLERVIPLPDSMALTEPHALAFNQLQNELYVGADGCVLVLDAATMVKTHRIPTAAVMELFYHAPSNRLFASCTGEPADEALYVIDCAAHEVIARIPVGTRPYGLCFDSLSGKLYCGAKVGDSVCVIDLPTLFPLGNLPVGERPEPLELNATDRKVYIGNQRSRDITVIDVDGDSVITTIADINHPRSLGWNPLVNKLYVAEYDRDNLVVVDCRGDSIIARVHIGNYPTEVQVSPDGRKVYVTCRSEPAVYVIDPLADTILACVELGLGAYAIACSPRLNRVFITTDATDELYALDGTTDSIVGVVDVGGTARFLQLSPDESTAYCLGYDHRLLSVVDVARMQFDTLVRLGFVPYTLAENREAGKVYVASRSTFGAVAVLDQATLEVRRILPVGAGPGGMVYNPAQAKLYVGSTYRGRFDHDTTVTVIDGRSDEVIGRVIVGRKPVQLCHNSLRDRVYVSCAAGDVVCAIDCATDSVVAWIPVRPGPYGVAYCSQQDKVYVACGGDNTVCVIDCATNTVVAITPVPPVHHVLYNPTVNRVYAFDSQDMVPVSVIDCWTEEVIAYLSSYRCVKDACLNGTGERVYFFTANGGYQVFDAYTNERLDSLYPGRFLNSADHDSIGDRLYIASMDSACVHVCDASTGELVTRVRLPVPAEEVICSDVTRRAFATCRDNSSVAVINIDVPGVAEGSPSTGIASLFQSTVVRGSVWLPGGQPAGLFDATGRRVTRLRPGANDLRRLSPGVYVMVEPGMGATRKILIAK